MTGEDKASVPSNKYYTKEERFSSLVVNGMKDFLGIFHQKRDKRDKGGGRRIERFRNVRGESA